MWAAPLDVVLDEERAPRAGLHRGRPCSERTRLVVEVLSPNPRIGRTSERVRWFMKRGVRECWLVHQNQRSVEVITFVDRQAANRRTFLRHTPIESAVWPDFTLSLDDILE
jgi:Uma2 family endonuclease